MKITNTTSSDLGLGSGTVIPAGSFAEIGADELAQAKMSPVVQAWFSDGSLIVQDGEKPTPKRRGRKPKAQKA